jgi:chromosome segregation ATPase
MKDIEVRCQEEKDDIRSDAQREEDNYERKLKEERSRLNEVQLKLNLLQAEIDNNEKSGKRQENELDELEDKLRKVIRILN